MFNFHLTWLYDKYGPVDLGCNTVLFCLSDNTTKPIIDDVRLWSSGLSFAALSFLTGEVAEKLKLSSCLRGDAGPGERVSSAPDLPSKAATNSATLSVVRLVRPGLWGVLMFSSVLLSSEMGGGGGGNASAIEEDCSWRDIVGAGAGGSEVERGGMSTRGDGGGGMGDCGGDECLMSENSDGGERTSSVVSPLWLSTWPLLAVLVEDDDEATVAWVSNDEAAGWFEASICCICSNWDCCCCASINSCSCCFWDATVCCCWRRACWAISRSIRTCCCAASSAVSIVAGYRGLPITGPLLAWGSPTRGPFVCGIP